MKTMVNKGYLYGGLFLAALFLIVGVMAPFIAPNDPYKIDLTRKFKPPGKDFPLGSDHLGRCVLSRVLHGTCYSVGIAFVASSVAFCIGLLLGLLSSGGRWIDGVVEAVTDVGLALPGLLMALVITGLFGNSVVLIIVALSFSGWPWWAKFTRDFTFNARSKEFVMAAIACGVHGLRLWRYYLVPQMFFPMMTALSLRMGGTILAISGLGYLGMGVQPPVPEWGLMLNESILYFGKAPWMMIFPGGAITLAVLGFNLLAEALRGVMDGFT